MQLDNVDATLAVRRLPQPGARLVGDRVTLLAPDMAGRGPDALSAWGVTDGAGQVLAWWDGGAQRTREAVVAELTLAGGTAQELVAIDLEGQFWRSALVR